MIQLPAQAQPFTLGPDGHVQWNPTANSWNASRLIAPADAGHTIQRSMSAAPDVFHNMPPASPLLQGHGGQTAWALPQRSMSVSPGPAQHVQPPAFGHAPQPSGVPSPQFAPTVDNGPSLSAPAPFGGAQPSQPVYQAPIRETLPPMPEPQSITSANLPSLPRHPCSRCHPASQLAALRQSLAWPPSTRTASLKQAQSRRCRSCQPWARTEAAAARATASLATTLRNSRRWPRPKRIKKRSSVR